MTIILVILLLGLVSQAQGAGRYVIAAPNMFRIGMEETVAVTVFNVNGPVKVKLALQDSPGRKKTFSVLEDTFENYKTKTVKMKVDLKDLEDQESTDKRYVYLIASSDTPGFTFHQETEVLLSNGNNIVFVQTDKPIYTPTQTVYIKVLPITIDLKPSKDEVTLEVLNPQGVLVNRWKKLMTERGFIAESLQLPKFVLLGNWTVRALFGNQMLKNTSVQFEVREYVLPTFSVEVSGPPYILESRDSFLLTVKAKYVYSKPVIGQVNLKVGVIGVDKDIIFVSKGGSQKWLDANGLRTFKIHLQQIMDLKDGTLGFPDGAKLFVEATVTERATGVQETTVHSSIHFTSTPYIINFKRTPKYFKPNLPFSAKIDVQTPDKKTASKIQVLLKATDEKGKTLFWTEHGSDGKSQTRSDFTNDNGQVQFDLQVHGQAQKVIITAFVNHSKHHLLEVEKGLVKFEAARAISAINSYLVLQAPKGIVTVGGEKAKLKAFLSPGLKIKKLHMIVTSRGRILQTKIWDDENAASNIDLTLDITADMSPTARVIAYAVTSAGHIISDSCVLEVEKVFSNKVRFVGDNRPRLPGTMYEIKIEADPGSFVGLLAVDKAVYLLRDMHRLTPDKAYKRLRSYDMGCGPGSGKDDRDVFKLAGLTVMAHNGFSTPTRQDYKCQAALKRRRRAIENDCCTLGRTPPERPGLIDCRAHVDEIVKRYPKHNNKSCKETIYECCMDEFGNQRGRNVDEFDEDEEELDVEERFYFPETWISEDYQIDATGKLVVPVSLPDSITTWVLQAVGVNDNTGLGIAEPYELEVFKQFFMQLTLPYSVQRGEQVSIIATGFNYMDQELEVTFKQVGQEGICTMAKTDKTSVIARAPIASQNAASVSFNIVPIAFDVNNPTVPIKITAYNEFLPDSILKRIIVKPEGVEREKYYKTVLDPAGMLKEEVPKNKSMDIDGDKLKFTNIRTLRGGKQIDQVSLTLPENTVPHSAIGRFFVTGNFMGGAVNNIVRGDLGKLLRIPVGCGEQTMIYTAPNVYVLQYILNTEHIKFTEFVEDNAYKNIQAGYNRELSYRRKDGSFSAWGERRQGSTWLTAFVAKVFCQAKKFEPIVIDSHVICSAIDYLVKTQDSDGAFVERKYVIHREMTGGIGDGKTAMTAFVLISLLECQCDTLITTAPQNKAVLFLKNNWRNIQSTFTLAITAYALALSGDPVKNQVNEELLKRAIYDKDTNTRYWNAGHKALNIETTGYALLAQIQLGRFRQSGAIVVWLTEQQSSQGGFSSTQDTCIGLQALAAYGRHVGDKLDLTITLTAGHDPQWTKIITVDESNGGLQQEVDITKALDSWLLVETKGTGTAQMQVESRFNVPTVDDELCLYDVSVRTKESMRGEEDGEEEEIEVQGKENKMKKNEKKKGGKEKKKGGKEKKKGGKKNNRRPAPDFVTIKICTRYKGKEATGMSIIEVGLWTGYEADVESLEKLEKNVSPGIERYEASARSVNLYLKEITTKKTCLRFTVKKVFEVGNIQAAPIKVYDYYEPEYTCTKFYGPKKSSSLLQGLCDKEGCRCTQDECPLCNPSNSAVRRKIPEICEDGDFDFAVLGRVEFVDEKKTYLKYRVRIQDVIFKYKVNDALNNKDELENIEANKIVSMWKEVSCCLEMETKKEYLILGRCENSACSKVLLDKNSFVREVSSKDKKSWYKGFYRRVTDKDECPNNGRNDRRPGGIEP